MILNNLLKSEHLNDIVMTPDNTTIISVAE